MKKIECSELLYKQLDVEEQGNQILEVKETILEINEEVRFLSNDYHELIVDGELDEAQDIYDTICSLQNEVETLTDNLNMMAENKSSGYY